MGDVTAVPVNDVAIAAPQPPVRVARKRPRVRLSAEKLKELVAAAPVDAASPNGPSAGLAVGFAGQRSQEEAPALIHEAPAELEAPRQSTSPAALAPPVVQSVESSPTPLVE